MFLVEKTSEFDKWLRKLKDYKAKAKILFRIQKIERDGHYGDWKLVGDGIKELRINFAKGYRIYLTEKEKKIIILLSAEINPHKSGMLKRQKTSRKN